jgi:uncharacterized repeat protein (TIGR01451 family)
VSKGRRTEIKRKEATMKRFARRFGCSLGAVSVAAVLVGAFALTGVGSAAQPVTANLQIRKTDSPDPVRVGEQLTYTITVEDLGSSPATGVTVTDNLPRRVDLVSATGPSGSCAVQGGKITCPIGSVKPIGINYGGAPRR